MARTVSDNQGDFARRFQSCIPGLLVILVVCLLAGLVLGARGFDRHGTIGLVAAVISGSLCFTAASSALVVTVASAGTSNATSGTLLGVFLRTAIPFFMAILLVQVSSPLADAGLFGMVLINYLIVLAVETVLAVRLVQAHTSTVVH